MSINESTVDKLCRLERKASEERDTSTSRVQQIEYVTALIDAAPKLLMVARAAFLMWISLPYNDDPALMAANLADLSEDILGGIYRKLTEALAALEIVRVSNEE